MKKEYSIGTELTKKDIEELNEKDPFDDMIHEKKLKGGQNEIKNIRN